MNRVSFEYREIRGLKRFMLVFVLSACIGCGGTDSPQVFEDPYLEDEEYPQIACSDPTVSTTSSMPEGSIPGELITGPLEAWSCDDDSTIMFASDGKFAGIRALRSELNEEELEIRDYHEDLWRRCRVGKHPSEFAGHWIVSDFGDGSVLCLRYDARPGRVVCEDLINYDEEFFSLGDYARIFRNGMIGEKEDSSGIYCRKEG